MDNNELLVDAYNKLKAIIKQSRDRDESLLKLTNDIDGYRKDFSYSAVKPLLTGLILFRESFNKELADTYTYAFDLAKVKKHLDLMAREFFDFLQNSDIDPDAPPKCFEVTPIADRGEGRGQVYLSMTEAAEDSIQGATAVPLFAEEPLPQDSIAGDIEETEEIDLNAFVDKITALIAGGEAKDAAINQLVKNSAAIDDYYKARLLFPLEARLIALGKEINQLSAIEMTEEDCLDKYRDFLSQIIDRAEDVLTAAGVMIESATLDDIFDPKKHRVLRLIPGGKEGQVAKRHTDCYSYDGKVIYPAKADVYKGH